MIEVPEDHVVESGDQACFARVERFYHGACCDAVIAEQRSKEDVEAACGIAEWVSRSGLSHVSVVCTTIPEKFLSNEIIQQELQEELGEDEDSLQELHQALQWFEVTSDEGRFALILGGDLPPRLYLEDSGVTVFELAYEVAHLEGGGCREYDSEVVTYPFIDGLGGEPSITLTTLGRLLREKKQAQVLR